MNDAEQDRRAAQKRRSVVIALALAALIVLVYLITVVRLQGDVLQRPF